jgi:mannose-6-phosphate isomerase-like protein (cupin superfamily)
MRKLLAIAAAALAVQACAHRTTIITGPGAANRHDVDAVLKANPVGPEEAVKAARLGADERGSFHLVQIRTREKPHFHASHDLVVNLVRGKGDLFMLEESATAYLFSLVPMRPGDSAWIGRGTTHFFVNGGPAPAIAFATYVPPFDGKDVVPFLVKEVDEVGGWMQKEGFTVKRLDVFFTGSGTGSVRFEGTKR